MVNLKNNGQGEQTALSIGGVVHVHFAVRANGRGKKRLRAATKDERNAGWQSVWCLCSFGEGSLIYRLCIVYVTCMYRICNVYVTCLYRRLYGKGTENGQGWDREKTGKIRGK